MFTTAQNFVMGTALIPIALAIRTAIRVKNRAVRRDKVLNLIAAAGAIGILAYLMPLL